MARRRGITINKTRSWLYGLAWLLGDVSAASQGPGALSRRMAVTWMDLSIYPVGSDLSARWEHPEGIVLTREDAERIGLEIEA